MANNQLKEELILSTQHFDKKIEDVIKRVNRLQHQGNKVGDGFNDSMGKMIQKATGFNGSLGSLVGVVGKFGGALGLAVSAGEIFNKMLEQSQNLGDAVTRVQTQASEAVNYFASSLASADFGGFLDGLRNIINLAGDAADAMDRATSIATRFGWTNQAQTAKYNKAMAEARNPENSKAERQKYLEQAKAISKEIAANETLKSTQDIKAAFTTIRTELAKVKYNGKSVNVDKLSDNQIRQLFDPKNFSYYEGLHNDMQQAKDGIILTNTKYGAHGAHLAQRDMEKYSNSNKMLAAYAANEINDNSDSPLAKALQMIGAADQLLSEQAKRSADIGKLGQRINKSADTIKKSGSSKSTKIKTDTEYQENSVGYLENKISELNKQIKLQVDYNSIKALQKEIEKTKGQLAELMQPTKKLEIDFSNIKPNFASATAITEELQTFLKREPLDITIKTDKVSLKDTANAIEDIGNALSSIGSNLDLPVIDVLGVIASAIASVIQGYAFATSKAGAELGPFGWIAFAATGLAELTAIIAQIHSLSSYANGGVIGGSSYGGDRLLARVNSGEAIVTQNQQNHLFEMLNNGTYGNGANGGNVHFVIKGKDLHGVLTNYNDKMKKVR